ncbi:MAG: ABC transporter ATP-binding protein [Bacteroidetes bacterium CG2_30_33_31]|nr:MAG: ABC transporter ATP-binding protein [Bacteroidetes bacterium CG2_30_33_31]
MNDNILSVEKLTKFYGSLKAVNELSFSVKKGSVFGVLGPNGSGKSTTLGMLTSVINPTEGKFNWFEATENEQYTKKLGTLLERPNFYGYMNAIDNLKIVAEIRGVSDDLIPDVLKSINLYERRKSRFKTFSFGMQQRLAIGSALLGNPEVLILDEPTNGLDPEGIAEIRQMIIEISKSGKTIILASHLLDEVQKVCSDVLILKKGKKIFSGNVDNIGREGGIIEMISNNLPHLLEVVQTHPKITSAVIKENMVKATASIDFDVSDINKYLMEYGVFLSHLANKKESLETQFLELLKSDKS